MRKRFERFCFRNRNKGIPNLMLYIVIATGLVTLTSSIGYTQIYDMLMFDRDLILKGQVWRLFTWVVTDGSGSASGIFMDLIMLYCYYSLGKAVENAWGSTIRFNLFYLGGVVLMDIFAIAFGGITINYDGFQIPGWYLYTGSMATFLHLSLLISFATLYPDAHFMIFFVIPIKAWLIATFYLIIIGIQIIQLSVPIMYFPHNLFPLVGLANYFLFFGKDVLNLFPATWQVKRKQKKQYAPQQQPINFNRTEQKSKPNYLHRCTVCGRTDVTNPELEFRYCSRCNGYFCYCQDHISDHTHIE